MADLSPGEQLLGAGIGVLFVASGLTWLVILVRSLSGLPVLRYEPRIRPRWRAGEVLAVFLLFHWMFLIGLFLRIQETLFSPRKEERVTFRRLESALEPPAGDEATEDQIAHPVIRLLRKNPEPATMLVCFFLVAAWAPISEEFIFRLVLLGFALRQEKLLRLRIALLSSLPRGALSVAAVSLWFALLHARGAEEVPDDESIWAGLVFTAVIGALSVLLIAAMAGSKPGRYWENLGIHPEKWRSDLRLGVLAFLAVTPPLWWLQAKLAPVFASWGIAPDPVPIFLLSVALGAVTASTGRIVPALILHMLHNFASLLIALVGEI